MVLLRWRENQRFPAKRALGSVRQPRLGMTDSKSTGSESSGTLVSSTDCLVCDGGIPSAGYVYAPANEELRHLHEAFVEVHMRDSVDNMLLVSAEEGDRRWIKETYLVQDLPDEDDDQPRICPDGGRKRERFTVYSDRPFASITYGPSTSESAEYALLVTTREHGQIELLLNKEAMYQLWTETHTTPCPEPPIEDDKGQLVQQLLHLADGASEERIETAIRALRGDHDACSR